MKTGYKICRRVAYWLLAVGFVLVIIALIMGASWHDATVSIVSENYLRGWTMLPNNVNGHSSWNQQGSSYNGSNNLGTVQSGKIIFDETYTGVTSLQFDFESAEVYVSEGNTFSISVSGSGEKFSSEVVNGMWKISSVGYKTRWGKPDLHYTVNITLPKGFVSKSTDINVGMGSLEVDTLSSEKSYLNVGMGEIEIDSFVSPDTQIYCGMGEVNVNGNLTGYTVIECGMGDVTLGLTGSEEEYGYTASVGMGDVRIGENGKLSGVGGDTSVGRDRKNQLSVDCGMGSVKVSFDE